MMNPNIWMSAYMHNNLTVEQGGGVLPSHTTVSRQKSGIH